MMRKLPLIALLGTLALGAACQQKDAEKPAAPPDTPPPPGDSLAPPPAAAPGVASPVAFHCDGLDFTVQYDTDHVTLMAPGKEYALPQVTAASGAKFQSDKATFWNKGREALVEIDGQSYANCREAAASDAPPPP